MLALFSGAFAQPQPDWPDRTTTCGFPFHDGDFGQGIDASRLQAFLAEGSAPLVFSLGSSAAHAADGFYVSAVEATRRLGQRAVLVLSSVVSPKNLPGNVLAIRSTAVYPLFKAASLVVHAGGIGTTAQAIRAGRPQLVVPFAHDQFDNALRVKRRSIGAVSDRKRLTAGRLARNLEQLLANQEIHASATAMAATIPSEDGSSTACDALERVLEESGSGGRRRP